MNESSASLYVSALHARIANRSLLFEKIVSVIKKHSFEFYIFHEPASVSLAPAGVGE